MKAWARGCRTLASRSGRSWARSSPRACSARWRGRSAWTTSPGAWGRASAAEGGGAARGSGPSAAFPGAGVRCSPKACAGRITTGRATGRKRRARCSRGGGGGGRRPAAARRGPRPRPPRRPNPAPARRPRGSRGGPEGPSGFVVESQRMQFICESCKANLQIADEKVRGKRLIVRCKRCGTQIRIADPALAAAQSGARPSTGPIAASRPAATPSAGPVSASQPARKPSTGPIRPAARSSAARDTDAESTRAMDSDLLEKAVRASKGDEVTAASLGRAAPARSAPPPPPPEDLSHRPRDPAVWFAMIGGKQTGPISRAELGLKTAAGQVGPRTYLWKEGMESWVRAKDVTEVSALFGTAPPPPLRDGRAAPLPAQNGEQHGAGLSFDSDPARTQAEQSVEARAQAQIDTPRPEARPEAEAEPAVAAAAEKEGAPASARDAAPDLFGSGPIPSPPAALDLVRWGANELARQRLQTPVAAPKAGTKASQLLLGQTERRSPSRVA